MMFDLIHWFAQMLRTSLTILFFGTSETQRRSENDDKLFSTMYLHDTLCCSRIAHSVWVRLVHKFVVFWVALLFEIAHFCCRWRKHAQTERFWGHKQTERWSKDQRKPVEYIYQRDQGRIQGNQRRHQKATKMTAIPILTVQGCGDIFLMRSSQTIREEYSNNIMYCQFVFYHENLSYIVKEQWMR